MYHSKFLRSASLTGASLIAMFAAGAAMAQDVAQAESDESASTGEIIVTAERRAGTASRTPMSITAIGGEELGDLRVQNAEDLVKLSPGLTVTPSQYGTPVFNIRGLSFDTYNMSAMAPVGIYVDQVSYAYPIMAAGGVFDVQRVEVLKGPQGTLYGRNTTGGLVNFISNQPTDEFEASATIEGGNYETFNTRGFISGPLAPTLKGRFAWQTNSSGKGWQESISRPGDRLGEVDKKAGRAMLVWDPAPAFKATLSANYWKDRSDTQVPQAAYYTPTAAAFGLSNPGQYLLTNGASNSQADWVPDSYQKSPNTSAPRPPLERNNEFYGLTANLEFQLNDSLTLYSLTGYNHLTRNETVMNDGVPFETNGVTLSGRIKSFSQEIRLAGEGEGFNWMVGGYYSNDKIHESQKGYTGDYSVVQLLRFVAGTLNDPRYTPTQIAEGFRTYEARGDFNNRSLSVFANGQINLTDTVKASAGIRYTEDRSRFAGCSADSEGNQLPIWNTVVALLAGAYPTYNQQAGQCTTFLSSTPNPNDPADPYRNTLKEHNVSWRASIDWSPTPSTMIYGVVARGYKAGAFPVIGANNSSQYDPATQEKVTSYELGAKTRVGPARLTLAGFYNDYRDKQVFGAVADPVFVTLTKLVNAPKSKTWGAEATVDLDLAPGLRAHGSAAYTRTKIIEYSPIAPFDTFGNTPNFKGTEFPNTPRWQLSGNISYETSVSENKKVEFLLDASYQSRAHSDFQDASSYNTFAGVPTIDAPIFNVPAYALVNGSVTLAEKDDKWRATLWVKNMFDKDYWRTSLYLGDWIVRYAGMPRTYGVSLTFNLGK